MIKKFIGIFVITLFIAINCYGETLNYNTDVFDLGNGKKNYKCHTAHINYKENGIFKKIDTTLAFDNTAKKWKHNKASYHPTIPEYSDGWFEFYNAYEGVNHTIKARPICDHVKGEYFADEGNGVIYKDAFGKGIDLKVYAYWAGLKKVIIINEKPTDTSKDLTFDFELELPANSKVLNKDNSEWSKTAKLDFKDKTIRIGSSDKYSYFRNATLWDSKELRQPVNIEMFVKNGKTYLRKTVTKDILEKAVYPLYTDHPTSYYTGAGDGIVQVINTTSWINARASTSGSADYTTAIQTCAQGEYYNFGTATWAIIHVFLPIDTSGITDTDTIISASLYLYTYSWNENNQTETINPANLSLIETSQADTASLTANDYDNVGTTKLANDLTMATLWDSTSSYKSVALNASGLALISKTSFTKIGFRPSNDFSDLTIPIARSYGQLPFSERGLGAVPYLDVTTEAGGSRHEIIMVN